MNKIKKMNQLFKASLDLFVLAIKNELKIIKIMNIFLTDFKESITYIKQFQNK
jgi:hypothetical protein